MADALELVGSLSSIVGLVVTIWILLRLRAIERDYLFRARVPELHRKLRGHCSTLSRLLASYPGSADDVRLELSMCRATLRSLAPKVERRLRAEIGHVLEHLHRTIAAPATASEELWEIHTLLVGLGQELKYVVKDMEWRART